MDKKKGGRKEKGREKEREGKREGKRQEKMEGRKEGRKGERCNTCVCPPGSRESSEQGAASLGDHLRWKTNPPPSRPALMGAPLGPRKQWGLTEFLLHHYCPEHGPNLHLSHLTQPWPRRRGLLGNDGIISLMSLAVLWPRRPGASVWHVLSACWLPENTSANLNIREQTPGFDMKRTAEEQPWPDCHVAFLSVQRFGLEDMHWTWKKSFIQARGDKHICMALIFFFSSYFLSGIWSWAGGRNNENIWNIWHWVGLVGRQRLRGNERWNAKFSLALLSFWRHFSLFYPTRYFPFSTGEGVDHVTLLLSTYIACLVLKGKHTVTTETSQPPEWEATLGFWLPGYLHWLPFGILNTNRDPLTHS